MNRILIAILMALSAATAQAAPLGLPEVPIPADNPQTDDKIKLGDKLFHDRRFSTTGEVSCSTCHDAEKGFTDNLRVSEDGWTPLHSTEVSTHHQKQTLPSTLTTTIPLPSGGDTPR